MKTRSAKKPSASTPGRGSRLKAPESEKKDGETKSETKTKDTEEIDAETRKMPPKKRGRPPKKVPLKEDETEEEEAEDGDEEDEDGQDGEDEASEETADASQESTPREVKKRGRKKKEKVKDEDKYVPDPSKRGIMAQSDLPLRRRDKIKSSARYSPEPYVPVSRRGRNSNTPMSFPSTSSSTKYISFDSDEELSPPKRKRVAEGKEGERKEGKSYVVDVKKDEESNKMLIMLPDGTTYKVDATPVVAGGRGGAAGKGKRKGGAGEEDDIEDDGAREDPEDEDYKPKAGGKGKKVKGAKNDDSDDSKDETGGKSSANLIPAAKSPKIGAGFKGTPKSSINRLTSSQPKVIVAPGKSSADGTRTTTITSGAPGKTKVTFITTPKSVTLTPAFKQPPKRSYGSAAKFIDELPEINECTLDDSDPKNSSVKLPDKALLISSDLPLKHALSLDNEKNLYILRQVISPVMSGFPCLLCVQPKQFFKEEKELCTHYSTQHELTIETSSAKFSEETVFVCLPRAIIVQIKENSASSIILNAPCQYCGDDVKLTTVEDMKCHYSSDHGKEIEIIEQEEILEMHKSLYCCVCSNQSPDFKSHHQHMKDAHNMQTFSCKACSFFTQDATRLKTHYKAKHMISHTMQNLQCSFCNGLVIGLERMNKHIMTSHCIQTATNEYSCISCLQPCGKSDELLVHSYRCPSLNGGPQPSTAATVSPASAKDQGEEKSEANSAPTVEVTSTAVATLTKCFLCEKEFESAEKCELHLSHVHTKWIHRNVLHDTFLMVRHPNGKTDIMPKPQAEGTADANHMKLSDLPSVKDLEEVGTKNGHGYYCLKCESVVKVYPLFYLHMYNVHKMDKMFQCKVTSCKQSFRSSRAFEEHIKESSHPQKSVIEDPLGAISCHFCDVHFADRKELEVHHVTEDHFTKISKLGEKCGTKAEPRNFKCKTCHTWFGLNDSFVYHMENETHKHGCPYCGLHFALPSSRRTHIQSHHSEKADICEICSQKQGSKERLFAHLVEHFVVFECNHCMKKFYQREQLNAHMETHGDPVQCPWDGCSRRVNQSGLTAHIRQHRIEVDSKCNICGKNFANRLLLATHMEVHAKAETSAKAILSTATAADLLRGTKTPTIHSLANKQQHEQQAGTTLISITTPKTSPGNMTVMKPKPAVNRSPQIKSPRMRPQKVTPQPQRNEIPEGLRVMCCTCNQLFNSQSELYGHKCSVPSVTTAESNANGTLPVKKQISMPKNKVEPSITATLIPAKDETTSDNLEEDPEKLVLDLAAQLTQAVQAEEVEKLKQKQLLKVEQLLYQQNQQQQQTQKQVQIDIQHNPLDEMESKQGKAELDGCQIKQEVDSRLGIKKREPTRSSPGSGRQKQSALRAEQEQLERDQLEAGEQRVEFVINNEDGGGDSVNIGEDSQMLMIQQPDGQVMQICVPAGMDINDVLASLNMAWSGTGDGNEQQEEPQVHEEGSSMAGIEMVEAQPNDDQSQGDQEQVIYIPVNEDGTYAIDSSALAMLTGGGDIPVVVSSASN